jgi:D-proline reductase (dithiol) PrdB
MVRVVEEAGIPTIYIGSGRDIIEAVKPPRAVFVNFPLGHQTGKPFDRPLQIAILKAAFETLKSAKTPGTIVDLPYQWRDGDDSWEKDALKRGEWV